MLDVLFVSGSADRGSEPSELAGAFQAAHKAGGRVGGVAAVAGQACGCAPALGSPGGGGDGAQAGAAAQGPASARLQQSWAGQAVGALRRSLLQQARQPAQLRAELFLASLSGALMGLNGGGRAIFVGILRAPHSLIAPAPMDYLLPSIGFFVCLTIGGARCACLW